MNKLEICQVFRSPKREGMYLYVRKQEGLDRVPEALLERFGEPEPTLVFKLEPERKLARASALEVMSALDETGYYLQLPPVPGAGDNDSASDARKN